MLFKIDALKYTTIISRFRVCKMDTFERYADCYDVIYKDKDYENECNFIEDVLRTYSTAHIKSVLDLGCGTGGHAIILAKRGYEVTGIDSSKSMIKRCKEKTSKLGLDIDSRVMDLRELDLKNKFDVCICMFSVMGYIIENDDFKKTLSNIRKHLKKGSLFIFEFWNGLAVLRNLPSTTIRDVEDNGMRIIRIAEPELDASNHICKVNYKLIIIEAGVVKDEIKEIHEVRFFFPQEIKHYLEEGGFELLKICPFLEINDNISENIWNVVAIAKKR